MKMATLCIAVLLSVILSGCEMPQVFRPVRLYDLGDGRMVEVFLKNSSPHSGRLVSANVHDERFDGEIALYRISTDLQYGDGIARDNKGRYYNGSVHSEISARRMIQSPSFLPA